jgi:hypothetical protein
MLLLMLAHLAQKSGRKWDQTNAFRYNMLRISFQAPCPSMTTPKPPQKGRYDSPKVHLMSQNWPHCHWNAFRGGADRKIAQLHTRLQAQESHKQRARRPVRPVCRSHTNNPENQGQAYFFRSRNNGSLLGECLENLPILKSTGGGAASNCTTNQHVKIKLIIPPGGDKFTPPPPLGEEE